MTQQKNKFTTFALWFTQKQNFVLIYTSALLLRSVFFLQQYVDYICKACLVWGVVIILYDLIKTRLKVFKVNNSYIPLVLCVLYAVSVIVNIRFSLYGGVKNLWYCAIYFFVLYDMKQEVSRETFLNFFKRNNNVFIGINLLIVLASLITFVFNIKTVYEVAGAAYKVGFWANRLNGVVNSNTATMFIMLAFVFTAVNYIISKGKLDNKLKALYIVNAVLSFFYYSLSGSRAATYCYIIVLVIAAAFIVYPKVRESKKIFKSIVCVVLGFVCLLASGYIVKLGSQDAMKKLPPLVSNIMCAENPQYTPVSESDFDFTRIEDFSSGNTTNGRFDMWKVGFKIFKQHPVFGIAYADAFDGDGNIKGNIDSSVFSQAEVETLKKVSFYYHNGFVQIAICGGAVFFAAFAVFAVWNVIKYLKFLFTARKGTVEYKVFVLIFALIVALIVDNMVEVHLLFSGQDAIAAEFWYILGVGLFIIKESEPSGNKKIEVKDSSND